MALATETNIRAAIVTTLEGVSGVGKVWNRFRRPLVDGSAAKYKELYATEANLVNVWMVRRVQRVPVTSELGDLISVTHVYELWLHFGYKDSETDSEASEQGFQLLIENTATALDANLDLGLDGVTHRSLAIQRDISDVLLGDYLCHFAACRLVVDAEDC
jgi:hypothetical protein